MKKLFALFTFILLLFTAYSQSVGIGTNTPNASAQLEIASTSKGLLIPRMTTVQRNAITSPVAGLMLYDTDLAAFYFYNGSSWNAVNSGGSNSWRVNGNNIYNSNTGNIGVGLSSGIKEKLSVKGNLFITHVDPNDIANGGSRAAINLHGASLGGSRINFLNADSSVGAYINYYRLSGSLKDFSLNHGANTNQLTLNENGNVGIGTVATEKLDVNGNIRSRRNLQVDSSLNVKGSLNADGNIVAAGGTISGNTLIATANLAVAGTGLVSGDFTSNSSVTINDANAMLQLKSSGIDKGFVQLSDNDIRMGVNAVNSAGRIILRSGAVDRLTVFENGNVAVGTSARPSDKLRVAGNVSIQDTLKVQDNIQVGGIVTKASTGNTLDLLPLAFGKTSGDVTSVYGTNNITGIQKIGTVYNNAHCFISVTGVTSSSVVIITPRYGYIVNAEATAGGILVYTWIVFQDGSSGPVFGDFSFVIYKN